MTRLSPLQSPLRSAFNRTLRSPLEQNSGDTPLSALGDALESLGYSGSYWYPGGDSAATLSGGLAWGAMWQDSTGATPVTALEQPVGFRADRRYLAQSSYGSNVVSTASYTGESAAAGSAHRIYSSAGAASAVEFASTLTVGQFYRVMFTIDSITTAGGGLLIGTTGATVLASRTGQFERGFLATSTTASIGRASGVTDIQISGVSFQAVTLPATVYGSDVVVNGEFATDTVWTKGTGWAIGSGIATHSGAPSGDLVQAGILTSNRSYEITGTTAVGAVTTILAGTAAYSTTAAGPFSCLLVANGADLTIRSAVAGSTVDNVVCRELKGTHLIQATSTARGTVSAAYNLLAYTEDLTNAAWTKISAPTITAGSIQDTTGGVYRYVSAPSVTFTAGSSLRLRIRIEKEISETYYGGCIIVLTGTSSKLFYGIWSAVNGTIHTANSTVTVASAAMVDKGDHWILKVVITDNDGNTAAAFRTYATLSQNGTVVAFGAGTARRVSRFDLRPAAYDALSIPEYQRRGSLTGWDYDTTGPMADGSTGVFPCYIRRQTDDHAPSTRFADLTGTDEVFVGYGGVKESDAAAGTALSLGTDVASVNGTFAIRFPVSNATTDFAFAARGTTTTTATATGHTAPKVAAIAGYADISTPTTSITVNGVTTTETGSLGTGNFASATVYDGSQAGTARWINDRCYYQLAVDGRATTASSRAALTAQLARDLMKLSY